MENPTGLDRIRAEFGEALTDYAPEVQPQVLRADRWILASGMQKAIRRGEAVTARSCAVSLLQLDQQMLWRRTLVTALEDIGVGDLVLATQVIAAADAGWRRRAGGDARVISYLIERMCDASKDRSADYLLSIAQDHPDHEEERRRLGSAEIGDLLAVVRDLAFPLPTRAVASWYAAGTDRFPSTGLEKRRGNLEALFGAYAQIGVEMNLIEACRAAARRMRDPFPVLIPLLWSELSRSKHRSVDLVEIASTRAVHGIPTYALDGHTRLGKQAVRQFRNSNEPVRDYVARHLEPQNWQKAVEYALFHVESGEVRRRLTWDQGEEIKALGIEADFSECGLDREAVPGLLSLVKENLDHLDGIRVELLENMRGPRQEELFAKEDS